MENLQVGVLKASGKKKLLLDVSCKLTDPVNGPTGIVNSAVEDTPLVMFSIPPSGMQV